MTVVPRNGCTAIVAQGEMPGVLSDFASIFPASIRPEFPDLILGSPPYALKGNRYEGGGNMKPDEWVDFMIASTASAISLCSGYVIWVVNGPVRGGTYHPVVERLIVAMSQAGAACERPLIWHKNAPPNRRDWFSNDWEYVVAFRRAGKVRPYFNPKGIGAAPKYKAGGHFRQRGSNGQRRKGGEYPTGKVTNARDVIRAIVGGGHMGSKLAHENEAPYPESLIEPIIKCCTRPGDLVLDPFCGSGTTLAVALRLGRNAIGIDSRHNGRLADPTNVIAKQKKAITAKRTKTDKDYHDLLRLDWEGSLYIESNRVVWPAVNIERMYLDAAAKKRRKKDAERSIEIMSAAPIEYDGPKDWTQLWDDDRFRFVRGVKIPGNRSTVITCRPIFPIGWRCTWVVFYNPSVINDSDVREWTEIAGSQVGLSDWRPKYGRFKIVAFKPLKD